MRSLKRLVVAACATVALAAGRGAAACECGAPSDVGPALATSDAVFRATVEAVTDRFGARRRAWYWIKGWFSDDTPPADSAAYVRCCGLDATLLVTASWKGVRPSERVHVLTGRGQGDCGFDFRVGVEYLVYARRLPSGEFLTDICTRTKPAVDAKEDLATLDRHDAAVSENERQSLHADRP
jgi:hypothetical protein